MANKPLMAGFDFESVAAAARCKGYIQWCLYICIHTYTYYGCRRNVNEEISRLNINNQVDQWPEIDCNDCVNSHQRHIRYTVLMWTGVCQIQDTGKVKCIVQYQKVAIAHTLHDLYFSNTCKNC